MSSIDFSEYWQLRVELDTGWPWPLSGVQGFFESLWNNFRSWIYDATNAIYQSLVNGLNAAANTILAALGRIYDLLPDGVKGVFNWLSDLAKGAWSALWDFVKDPVGKIWSGLNWVASSLQSRIDAATNSILAVLQDVKNALGVNIVALSDKVLGGISATFGVILKPLQDFVNWLWSQLVKGVGAVAGILQQNVISPVWNRLQWLWSWMIGGFKNVYSWIVESAKNVCAQIQAGNPDAAMNLLSTFAISGSATMAMLSVVGMKIFGSGIEVDGISGFLKDLFSPSMFTGLILGTLLGTAIRDPLTQHYRSVFRTALPGTGDLRTYFLRGYINEDTVKRVLAKHGLSDFWIKCEMDSWWIIPGVSDLITFVVREVISPEEFYGWAAKQGLSEYWAKNYWEAHWVLPSFGDLREAFWRGIISKEEFMRYIVWHDYKPEPRPGISKSDQQIMSELSYRLPGRIDARWMVRWGIIGTEDLQRLVAMEGMHPEWVPKIAEAEWMNILLDERNALRNIYIRQFRLGLINEDELRSKLKACYFHDREIDWTVQRAKLEYALDMLEDEINAAKEAYRKDLLTDEEFLGMLLDRGIPEERARLIVARESFKKLPRPRR